MPYKVQINPGDPVWASCYEDCPERLPDVIYGHIYQHWDGGLHFQGSLFRDPLDPTWYSGTVTAPDSSTTTMIAWFCFKELYYLLIGCDPDDWCWGRWGQAWCWYCFPFAYLTSDDGDVSYKIHL